MLIIYWQWQWFEWRVTGFCGSAWFSYGATCEAIFGHSDQCCQDGSFTAATCGVQFWEVVQWVVHPRCLSNDNWANFTWSALGFMTVKSSTMGMPTLMHFGEATERWCFDLWGGPCIRLWCISDLLNQCVGDDGVTWSLLTRQGRVLSRQVEWCGLRSRKSSPKNPSERGWIGDPLWPKQGLIRLTELAQVGPWTGQPSMT